MEHEMRSNLLACATVFATARGITLATVGRLAAGDWRFFERLLDDEKTFTARKYDDTIGFFALNWPDGVAWPSTVSRPELDTRSSSPAPAAPSSSAMGEIVS